MLVHERTALAANLILFLVDLLDAVIRNRAAVLKRSRSKKEWLTDSTTRSIPLEGFTLKYRRTLKLVSLTCRHSKLRTSSGPYRPIHTHIKDR